MPDQTQPLSIPPHPKSGIGDRDWSKQVRPEPKPSRLVPKVDNASEPIPLRSPDPLSHVFRHQYDQLVRFCRARITNPADAEDLVQDAFLSIRRAYADKPEEDLRALLFTTVRNLSVNYLKSGRIRQARQSDEIGEVAGRLACQRTPTPEQMVMDAQRLAIAEQTIAAMKPRKRNALRLHRYEGLTYDEIARRLSVSATTVKTDIAEAVAEIAESLSGAAKRTPGRDE
ncbi:RNA polymerase sigma factor [Hyphomonas jannaschiana]|uniref:RNA polymerase sigma factor n=1 Tax=Hyphomonas jannaschiana TaxID=86 RepID=UPI00138E2E6B|nr:sigma-70 family RNA polymerase sigma factor [Hyphomonas jannaschiana]